MELANLTSNAEFNRALTQLPVNSTFESIQAKLEELRDNSNPSKPLSKSACLKCLSKVERSFINRWSN
jgi:hypothetical protein